VPPVTSSIYKVLQLPWLLFDLDQVASEVSTKSRSTYFRWAIIGDLMFFGGISVLSVPMPFACIEFLDLEYFRVLLSVSLKFLE